MVNLVGEVPPLERLLAVPGAHVHLYGKTPRAGRKLGHVTLVDADDDWGARGPRPHRKRLVGVGRRGQARASFGYDRAPAARRSATMSP